jgi:transposase
MRASAAAQLDFVPIVPATSMPLPAPTVARARSSPSIEIELAGAVLRVAPGTDADLLTTVLRAIRASAA